MGRVLVLAAIPLAVLAVGVAFYLQVNRNTSPDSSVSQAPGIVIPDDLAEIDPQIRTYISEQIELAQEGPSDAMRHATLGLVYAANALWTESKDSFRNASSLAPDNVLAKYHLAIATLKCGDEDEAFKMLREVTEAHPDFAPAHHRLGVMLLESGLVAEAEVAMQNAVRLAPEKPEGYVGIADVAVRQREYERAVQAATKALELRPNDRMAHYLLGMSYRALGQRDDAMRELKLGTDAKRRFMADEWSRVKNRHNKGVAFQIRLAQRLLQRGKAQQARQVLDTVLHWRPDNVEALNDISVVHMKLKEPEEALVFLQQALGIDEANAATNINLAACFLDLGRLDDAFAYANKAVELAPTVSQAHVTKANVLLRMQRREEAADALKTASQLDPQNAAVAMSLARTYISLGRLVEARQYCEVAVEQSPVSVQARLTLCELCLHLGDLDCAATVLSEARRLAPHNQQVDAMSERLESMMNR